MSYSASQPLYLDKQGQATTEKTDTPYLVPGAVISDEEAVRVGLREAPKGKPGNAPIAPPGINKTK